MSDSPKRLVKDRDKKKSYKKSSSLSSIFAIKDKDKKSVFEKELAKIGSSQFSSVSSKDKSFDTGKTEDIIAYAQSGLANRSEEVTIYAEGGKDSSSESEKDYSFESEEETETLETKLPAMSSSVPSYYSMAPAPATSNVNAADVEILTILRNINVDEVLKASTLDIMSKTQAERREIVIAAVHCMCNGPVGVNKITNFPLLTGERSIKSMIDCSNRTWKAFCLHLINDLNFNCTQNCYTKDEFGSLWPLCEGVMKNRTSP